jgi:DNA-binding NtrC family response regulator
MNHFIIKPDGSNGKAPRARLLVADDDAFIRELHSIVLRADGYEVATAEDGEEALFHLASEKFDLLVTDWQMPKLDGADLVVAMRTSGICIPVIMVSGSCGRMPLPPDAGREIFATIPKPARAAELLSAVARALRPVYPREEHRPAGRALRLVA